MRASLPLLSLLLVAAVLLPGSASSDGDPSGAALREPVTVSPGGPELAVRVEGRCPTFSWGAVTDARSYELVIYEIGEDGAAAEEVVQERVPGSATAWTPALHQCLERGSRYAWVIRAVGSGTISEWSSPSLFQLPPEPSAREVEEALRLARHYLDSIEAASAENGEPVSVRPLQEAPAILPRATEEADLVPDSDAKITSSNVFGIAQVTIEGEVRTVDESDNPRLWGEGRPQTVRNGTLEGLCTNSNNVRFGLSSIAVEWGSAAAACPAGTWVCTAEERGFSICNTLRWDRGADYYDCRGSGTNRAANDHLGWLADVYSEYPEFFAVTSDELGFQSSSPPCAILPVWCCSN